MNSILFAYIYNVTIFYTNADVGKSTIFALTTGSFMYFWGIAASYLFYGGLFGIPSLLSALFWIIYTIVNIISASNDWATYKNVIDIFAADLFSFFV